MLKVSAAWRADEISTVVAVQPRAWLGALLRSAPNGVQHAHVVWSGTRAAASRPKTVNEASAADATALESRRRQVSGLRIANGARVRPRPGVLPHATQDATPCPTTGLLHASLGRQACARVFSRQGIRRVPTARACSVPAGWREVRKPPPRRLPAPGPERAARAHFSVASPDAVWSQASLAGQITAQSPRRCISGTKQAGSQTRRTTTRLRPGRRHRSGPEASVATVSARCLGPAAPGASMRAAPRHGCVASATLRAAID